CCVSSSSTKYFVFADYGCMLEILSLELLADGRSYVDTVGGSRFRVLKRGQRDGYHTADIEYLEDLKVDGSELELLQRLHDSVYQQAQDWYQRLGSRIREQINRQYGTMPDKDGNIQVGALMLFTNHVYETLLLTKAPHCLFLIDNFVSPVLQIATVPLIAV
uniref:Lon N-terminal domain-containing protein n=1 Tax=Seriola lalandi dorsalis TaxID=1841481 RepID=A0A3B4XLJ2_SERLL